MLQDTAVRARPSGLACRSVLRLSGKIMQIRTSLARRLRSRLFFIVVTCFGKQMCKIRERPCAASKPFLPRIVFRMCDDTLSSNSSKGTSALVDLQEKSGVDFSKTAAGWTQCSPDSHSHVWNHGGTTSAEQRRALEEVLYRKRAATIYQAVQRYNLVVNKA